MNRITAALLALCCDAALVIAFVIAGRGQHERAESLAGVWESAWPFLAALAVSWILLRAWRRPVAVLSTGVPLWVGTVAVGMLLRVLCTAGGAAPGFIAVASGVLALFLIGWRLIVLAVSRRSSRSTTMVQ